MKLVWLIGPDYEQATEEFRYIMEWGLKLGLINAEDINTPTQGSRTLRTRLGAKVETKSGRHPERLGSVAPDMIVLCEPGQMSNEVYMWARGRLAQNRGTLAMAGTLEDDLRKRRWAWYERLISEWIQNEPGADSRAFCVPTWSNRVSFPLGLQDPELLEIRAQVSDYTWARRYGGRPEGVEDPMFPVIWEAGAMEEFLKVPEPDVVWQRGYGAIGVDYGRSWTHPSAVVAITMDQYDRYWVRAGWTMVKADPHDIQSIVEAYKSQYHIFEGCVDPNQGFMGDLLGFDVAIGGTGAGGRPTEMRFSLANGLLENRSLYLDITGPGVGDVWDSMLLCARTITSTGEKRYERPEGDDLAQSMLYAIEKLRGGFVDPAALVIDAGTYRMSYVKTSPMEGRA